MATETVELEQEWRTSERWAGILRPYGAADVERLRGSIRIRHTLAELGAERLWELLRTDRGRCGGRVRWSAPCVRDHEGDDRGRRGRSALRGPARGREEVRPSGGKGRRSHGRVHSETGRGASRGGRHGSAYVDRRADGCEQRPFGDERFRSAGPCAPHRRQDRRRILPNRGRTLRGDRSRSRVCTVRGYALVRDVRYGSRRGPCVRRCDPRPIPREDPRLQLLLLFQLAEETGPFGDRKLPV